jgi:hypothetical protein
MNRIFAQVNLFQLIRQSIFDFEKRVNTLLSSATINVLKLNRIMSAILDKKFNTKLANIEAIIGNEYKFTNTKNKFAKLYKPFDLFMN